MADVSASISVGTMIRRISGLAGTKDVSAWESQFIADIDEKTIHGERTGQLSDKQLGVIMRIHARHFEVVS